MGKLMNLTAEQWAEVERKRTEWLAWGLSTAPADRPTAEKAITEMYRLVGKERPQFLWVDSPATANLAIWLFDGKLNKASSLYSSLASSLYSSLASSLYSSLDSSLASSMDSSLRSSLDSSLASSLYSSLASSLYSSMDSSLYSSLASSLASSMYSSLASSMYSSLRSSLASSMYSSLRSSLASSLRSSRLTLNYQYLWGQMEAYWVAFYQVPEQLGIVTYAPEDSRRLELWASIARSCGWWWPFEGLCIVSERPQEAHTEPWVGAQAGAVRLHCEDGPALAFRDGWTVHAWHGTTVPASLIEGEGWTPEQIFAETNQEVRRCAIERIGWDTFVQRAELKQVGTAVGDPGNPGNEIALYDVPEQIYDEPVRVLLCTNGTVERDGTRRRFGLTVPAHIGDPVEAAAWTYDWPVEAYRALEVRR